MQQLQIVLAQDWFSNGTFYVEGALSRLAALPALARQLGYSSIRAWVGLDLFSRNAGLYAV
jgi:hypothetical protein